MTFIASSSEWSASFVSIHRILEVNRRGVIEELRHDRVVVRHRNDPTAIAHLPGKGNELAWAVEAAGILEFIPEMRGMP